MQKLGCLTNWHKLPCKARDFMFGTWTTSLEKVNGVMLLAIAITLIKQPQAEGLLNLNGDKFHIGVSIGIIGALNLLLTPLLCRANCRATRGFLLGLSSVVWAGVAAAAYTTEPPIYFRYVGAAVLFTATMMALLTVITGKNNVGEFRKYKD